MGDCPQNCPVAARVDALNSQLDEFQAQNTSSHREIYGRLNHLERFSDVQSTRYDSIIEKLDGLTKNVDTLKLKPAKRWDAAITGILSAVCTGVTVYLLAGGRIG